MNKKTRAFFLLIGSIVIMIIGACIMYLSKRSDEFLFGIFVFSFGLIYARSIDYGNQQRIVTKEVVGDDQLKAEKIETITPFVLETEFAASEPLQVTVEGFADGKLVLSDTKTYHSPEFLTLPSKQTTKDGM